MRLALAVIFGAMAACFGMVVLSLRYVSVRGMRVMAGPLRLWRLSP